MSCFTIISVSSQPSQPCVNLCHGLLCYLFHPNPVIIVFTCVMFYYVICFNPTQSSLCLPVSCFTMLSVSSQPSHPCVYLCHVLLCYLFHPNPVSLVSTCVMFYYVICFIPTQSAIPVMPMVGNRIKTLTDRADQCYLYFNQFPLIQGPLFKNA